MTAHLGSVDVGTAIRTTRVRPDPASRTGGAVWTRSAPHPDHPFSAVPVFPLTSASGHRLVTGDGDDLTRSYRLPASRTVADSGPVDWAGMFRHWGVLLAALHSQPPGGGPKHEPPARIRLRTWWSRADLGDRRRSANRALFLDELDLGARDRLDDILTVDLRRNGILVHGWADIGHCVVDPSGHLTLMIGEDVGHAPPEFDLGALTAQAMEFAVLSPVRNTFSPRHLRAELLASYAASGGPGVDRARLDDHTLEHVVRHVADVVWFADHDAAELPRWATLVNWLDRGTG